MQQAAIITIGDELFIGQVIDTNSAWMAQQLNAAGIGICRRLAVGDLFEEIWKALDEVSGHCSIILITGGLGPTADDITKPLLCEYFNANMRVDEAALANVEYLFTQVFKRPLTERNKKQAEVPDNCRVILNKLGTAPGMWFERDEKIFVSMPGVPHEMKAMMVDDVIPALLKRFNFPSIAHRTCVCFGVGESTLADILEPVENTLPPFIKLAYLPDHGLVRLRLTGIHPDEDVLTDEINTQWQRLKTLASEYIITDRDERMESIIARMLTGSGKTVSTAESCTGGYIAHLLTSQAGASTFYLGSIISYSNRLKEQLLEVSSTVLESFGAVSEEVVIEMARAVKGKLGTDYSIAVSGIMGPSGAVPEKPVGTVWIAVAGKEAMLTRKFHFRYDRQKNVEQTAIQALNLLRELVLAE